MKKVFLLSLFTLTSCFRSEKGPVETAADKKVQSPPVVAAATAREKKNPKDVVLTRLARYLEQADAVQREAWWVVAAEKKVQGRSIFGKAQRALLTEMGMKLANKSLFRCDRYIVKRDIMGLTGLPQKGEIFQKCSNQAELIAEYEISKETTAKISFYPQYLGEVMGLSTSILNRKVICDLMGDEEGKLEKLKCENMAQDRNGTESIQFTVYQYEKAGKSLLTLKAQVYEELSPMKKIEAQVPLAGKIHVTETQVEAPEGYIRKSDVKMPPPPPKPKFPPVAGPPDQNLRDNSDHSQEEGSTETMPAETRHPRFPLKRGVPQPVPGPGGGPTAVIPLAPPGSEIPEGPEAPLMIDPNAPAAGEPGAPGPVAPSLDQPSGDHSPHQQQQLDPSQEPPAESAPSQPPQNPLQPVLELPPPREQPQQQQPPPSGEDGLEEVQPLAPPGLMPPSVR